MSKHVDTQVPQSVKKPRIVILGSGWGAMSFIKGMSKKDRYVSSSVGELSNACSKITQHSMESLQLS